MKPVKYYHVIMASYVEVLPMAPALLFSILGTACSLVAAASPEAGSIRIPLKFENTQIRTTEFGSRSISIPGLMNTMEAGMPSVPFKTYKIALPAGTTKVDLKMIPTRTYKEEGTIERSQSQVPLSETQRVSRMATIMDPDSVLPIRGGSYPANRTEVNIQTLHNTPIAIINVYPVLATDQGASAEIMEEGELIVTPTVDKRSAQAPRFAHQQQAVASFVDNPEALSFREEGQPANYDYLIISSKELIGYTGQNGFADLQQGLEKDGLKSRVVSIEEIESAGTGSDRIEKIREYIKNEYTQNGIRFVLLAGDGDDKGKNNTIPSRKMWSKINSYNGSWKMLEEQIAADMYYACLDGVFNANGNNKWGEPGDGGDGKDIDLLSEVAVGRACLDNTEHLQNFVSKTLWFRSAKLPKNIYLVGEELFKQKNLYGSAYMDQFIGHSTDHNYETNGYDNSFKFGKLYDTPQKSTTAAQALQAMNQGYPVYHHLGHCNVNIAMRISWYGKGPNFTNKTPFFLYTQGCFPGKFVASDCWIENLCNLKTTGAVAAIANTTYGLGPEDPAGQFPSCTKTPGAQQMMHRQFVNHMQSQGVKEIAVANQKSKEYFVGMANHHEIRWCFFNATVFGDPSLTFNFE